MGKPGKYGGKGRMYNNPSFHKGKGFGQAEVTWQTALDRLRETDPTPGVPSWNGDPDRFPTFTQECAWYLASLKENEKALAVARVWANLRSSAKLSVSRLQTSDFSGADGLERLIEYLRQTPLAKQPLPDAY